MSKTETQPTKIKTGKVRFSYAKVWEATQMVNPKTGKPEGKKKFSVVLLIPKKDKAGIRDIQDAIKAAETLGYAKEWKGRNVKYIEECLHDGDEKFDSDPEKYDVYKGHMYLSPKANENRPPQVCKIVSGRVEAITERDEFYSGCYGKAVVNFFAYEYMGKFGIGVGLNSVLKLEDGENLGGGYSNAEDDYAEEVDENGDL